MADSLEDDFALSDVESIQGGPIVDGLESDGEAKPVTKRQANNENEEEETEEEKRARKKRKMKQQDKNRKAKKAASMSGGGPGKIATLPPNMQADHIRKLVKSCKQYSKMTDLELDEVGVQESMLADSTTFTKDRNLDGLVAFISDTIPSATKDVEKVARLGSGHEGHAVILVVTGHAQRAADIAKVLRKLNEPSKESKGKLLPVAKLFARHFKLAEQESFLKTNVCPVAVGTPQRVHDLLQKGDEAMLKLSHLRAIILDASWSDAKMRTLLDGPETREALCSLLASSAIQSRLRSTKKEDRAVVALF